MYIKVHCKGTEWFRDDNGALVGEIADTYHNVYYSRKQPIIKTNVGNYIKPIYGRINPKSKEFVPLCEGERIHLCTGTFCKGFSENPYICPRHNKDSSVGYYILID